MLRARRATFALVLLRLAMHPTVPGTRTHGHPRHRPLHGPSGTLHVLPGMLLLKGPAERWCRTAAKRSL